MIRFPCTFIQLLLINIIKLLFKVIPLLCKDCASLHVHIVTGLFHPLYKDRHIIVSADLPLLGFHKTLLFSLTCKEFLQIKQLLALLTVFRFFKLGTLGVLNLHEASPFV